MEIAVNSREVPGKQKEVNLMCSYKRFSVLLVLGLFFVGIGSRPGIAQTQMKTVNNPQGGKIVYGPVTGATNQGSGLITMLRMVHNDCGERPQIGRVFRFRGTETVGVFFTAVNHPEGNKQMAGLVMATLNGSRQVEAAMLSDWSSRFGSTINPMLTKLFSLWHPEGAAVTGSASPGRSSALPSARGAGGGGAIPPMHQVVLPDSTASFSVPSGWNVDPRSGGGSTLIAGPKGEHISLNMYFMAQDPYSQAYQNQMRMGIKPLQHLVLYPSNADLAKSFADVFQRLRAFNGLGPAPLKVASVQRTSGSQGHCVDASGQVNPYGQGMAELKMLLCRTAPDQCGDYFFIASQYQVPLGATDQQCATAAAVMASYQVNTQLVQSRASAQAAPYIAQMKQNWQAHEQAMNAANQRAIDNIHQIGATATARMNSVEAQNDAQHESFHQHEDDISRNGQGFSNYLLDQTVIHDVQDPDTHVTVWNRTAEAWERAYPDRVEEVPTSQYIKGQDFF